MNETKVVREQRDPFGFILRAETAEARIEELEAERVQILGEGDALAREIKQLREAAQESWTAVQFLLNDDDPNAHRRTLGELQHILRAALADKEEP